MFDKIKVAFRTYFNKFCEVGEVLLLVDGDLVVLVDDAVVLHPALEADAERVVAGEVGGLPHQEQAVRARVQQLLGRVARDLAVEPGHPRHLHLLLGHPLVTVALAVCLGAHFVV